MKITVLTSGTNNTPPLYEPLRDLGHDLTVIVYDAMTHSEHRNIPFAIDRAAPDWVLYIGAIEEHHGKPVPNVNVLADIGSSHPLVHCCCDGAEPYWWRQLERYYDRGRFALQVNIDGVRIGPIGDRGLTLLCPVDTTKYRNVPWKKRKNLCGFSGGLHAGRAAIIMPLEKRGLLARRDRNVDDDQSAYRKFNEDCCVGINAAHTGGNTGQLHVKFRAGGELPAAGCLVLETKGSPLGDWFEADKDYLQYGSVEEAAAKIVWVRSNMEEAEAMAARMRKKVIAEHSPAAFWSQVMDRIGLGEAIAEPRVVPHATWSHFVDVKPKVPPAPILVRTERSVNLVSWNGKIHAVPQGIGRIELDKCNGHPRIKVFDDVATAVSAVQAGRVA